MLVLHAVVQLDEPIFEAFTGAQLQVHVTVTPRYQWDALPDEHRDHADDELVDRPRVEKGGDDLAATHQPDILAGLLSKTAHVWADGLVHELDACRGAGRRRLTGEDDGPIPGAE